MRYENKRWTREGQHFLNSKSSYDLSNIKILHTGVDTVKELFQCLIDKEVLAYLSKSYEENTGEAVYIGDFPFLLNKSSKKAGYQWILRNNDIGIVVLLKSFYVDTEFHGSHIKIEGSPHLINQMSPEDYSSYTLMIAKLFGSQVQAVSCAAHLAVDLKGWAPDENFEYSLVTRAKRKMSFSGISKAEFDMAESSAIYGDRETFTFGSASSVQLCVYDKSKEALKTDKIDFWRRQWQQVPSVNDVFEPEYKDGDRVTRIEGRIHHSVVNQFCNGTVLKSAVKNAKGDIVKPAEYLQINNFADLSKHLTGLWQYVLNSFRLHHSTSYVHPLWQFLEEDVEFFEPFLEVFYKRAPKTPNDNINRRIGIWLGNTINLYGRKRIKASIVSKHILRSGLDSELKHYFGLWGPDGTDALSDVVYDFVQKKMERILLQGIAA